MPPHTLTRLPTAALRRAVFSAPRLPANHRTFVGSHQTQMRLAKITQLVVFGSISGSIIYYYDDIMQYVSGEPTEEEKKAMEKARIRPQQAKVDLQSSPSADALGITPKTWTEPGLYLWGLNTGKVVDPTADKKKDRDGCVGLPRRLEYFDGQVLRDVKLRKDFGVAVTEKGDLVEWGQGYDKKSPAPEVIMKGHDIIQVAVSSDRIIALSSKGQVFSIPAAKSDQKQAPTVSEPGNKSSWLPSLWSTPTSGPTSCRIITPTTLAPKERITSIASGTDHCLLLTSAGRVFSAASSTTAFPAHGQLGVPGLTWENRPEGPYYQPHEVTSLTKRHIIQIAAGDQHSLALAKNGTVWGFGDNMYGQLGFPNSWSSTSVFEPKRVDHSPLYGRNAEIEFTNISAGGYASFFSVDSPKVPGTEDVWAAGQGQMGTLGTGKWVHMTKNPVRAKALSGMREYSESDERIVGIRARDISVGATHAAAILEGMGSDGGARDMVLWGGNENSQLGNGKRANVCAPVNIPAVEGDDVALQRLQAPQRGYVVRVGEKGKKMKTTQKIECGEFVTALYTTPQK